MPHEVATLLADCMLLALVLGLPAMYFIFSDRFRRVPSAPEFSALFVVVGLTGIVFRLPALAVLAAAILLSIGLAWLAARYCLRDLTYTRALSPSRLFPDEEGTLTVRIENRKLLPLAWLQVMDPIEFRFMRHDRRLDDVLAISPGVQRDENRGWSLVTRTALGPFEALTRTHQVRGLKRGVYVIGPAVAESGDPFGLFPRRAVLAGGDEIVVYPRVYSTEEIAIPFREMIGDLIPPRALVEDPMLIAGSREYRPGDPLRRIHWKATARTGDLQVRLLDPSTTASVLLVVNLNTHEHVWQGADLDRVEATIDAAASLAVWALDRGYATGIRTNGTPSGTDRVARIPPSASPRQASVILDHLARLSFYGRFSAEEMLLDESARTEAGAAIVFVTPYLSPSLTEVLRTHRVGSRISLVFTGTLAPASIHGLPVHVMAPPQRIEA